MIIVSQDKEEIVNFDNMESIWISVDGEGRFTIESTATTNSTLGHYKTKERAKEVLQEIASTYSKIGIEFDTYNGGKIQQLPIFEMPED